MSVIIIVADGARPDTLGAAMDRGDLPALARLRTEGSLHEVTSAFPSVTGPAYVPFLMGRFPGQVGLPGLRWYDRSRTRCSWPSYARSYVGHEARHLDGDLDPAAPTLFSLAPSSLGALNVINRGLPAKDGLSHGLMFMARTGITHFRGDLRGWLDMDRSIGNKLVQRVARDKPEFVFAAFTGIDKTSHAAGHGSNIVVEAMQIVDDVVGRLRDNAERDGRWGSTHLWIVSDHGHSPVLQHEDLAAFVVSLGFKVKAHPWVFNPRANAAVMVSGNAMAHLYFDLDKRERPYWPALEGKFSNVADALLKRDSVDLLLLPRDAQSCLVRNRDRGEALVKWANGKFDYKPLNGDPLNLGELGDLTADEAYAATIDSDYPDALVQIASISRAPRAGDLILSAARNWDFRAKHEPIPHVSSHGALHREHMLVPLLTNRPVARQPLRTVDIMPSALVAMGIEHALQLDGQSFI